MTSLSNLDTTPKHQECLKEIWPHNCSSSIFTFKAAGNLKNQQLWAQPWYYEVGPTSRCMYAKYRGRTIAETVHWVHLLYRASNTRKVKPQNRITCQSHDMYHHRFCELPILTSAKPNAFYRHRQYKSPQNSFKNLQVPSSIWSKP